MNRSCLTFHRKADSKLSGGTQVTVPTHVGTSCKTGSLIMDLLKKEQQYSLTIFWNTYWLCLFGNSAADTKMGTYSHLFWNGNKKCKQHVIALFYNISNQWIAIQNTFAIKYNKLCFQCQHIKLNDHKWEDW